MRLPLTKHQMVPGTTLYLVEANSVSKYVTKGKALQIGAGGLWLVRGDMHGLSYKVQSSSIEGSYKSSVK